MDLSASSRLITSALTSLEVPLHDYEEDVRDEIVPDRNKDDNGPSPAAHQGPSKDQQLSISMDSSLIIPVPGLHFNTSTPESHSLVNGSVLGSHSGLGLTPGSQDSSLALVSPSCHYCWALDDYPTKTNGQVARLNLPYLFSLSYLPYLT